MRRLLLRMSLVLAAATGTGLAAAPARAADPLPVPYTLASLLAGSANPDVAPGANDFSCRPSAAHPRPVVLVHGLLATLGTNWQTMAPLLKNNGFCVFGLTYGRQPGQPYLGGLKPMEESAKELDAFVDRVLQATGADKVDLLGHSEGTVMPRYWLRFMGGAAKVDKYVGLTPLWNGTNLAAVGDVLAGGKAISPTTEDGALHVFASIGCGSCPQFVRGSRYLQAVNAAPGPAEPGIDYTSIVTKYDELVVPYTSGLIDAPNVKNVVLQDLCPTDGSEHAAVAYDPVAAQVVLNALAPAQARPVPCAQVTPFGTANPPQVGLGPEPAPAAAGSGAASVRCTVRLTLPRRGGAAIRRVVVTRGGRRVATARGRALRSVRVPRQAAGKRAYRVRITDTRGTRTVTLRRTVRCA